MIKKLTRYLLSTILTVLLAVGVFGIAAPKEAHAATYTGEVKAPNLQSGDILESGSVIAKGNWSYFAVIVDDNWMGRRFETYPISGKHQVDKVVAGTGNGEIWLTTNVHTHSWTDTSYSASGNVITATCQGSGTCDLEKPTLTLTASGKTYDGSVVTATLSANSTWTTDNGLPAPEENNIIYDPANSKNVGDYTASYTVANATATQSFKISPKEVGLTWGDNTFTYDGQSHAPTASISGVVSGDTCNVSVDGAQIDAGNYNATASIDNNNYTLPSNKTKDFTINKRALTLKDVTTEYKVYDGNDSVKIKNPDQVTLDNVVDGDDVSINQLTGVYTDGKDAGENKAISVTATLKGEKKNNYEVTPRTDLTESIVKKAVIVKGIKASNKPYDGTTDATIDTTDAVFDGKYDDDELTISPTGAFVDANVGENKTVNLTLGELGGADDGNYELDLENSQTTAKASITPLDMSVSATGYTGTFDEQSHSITVTVTDPASGATITYKGPDDTDYGSSNPEFTLPGEYVVAYKVTATNYKETNGTATVKINPADLNIPSTPYSEVYDGNDHTIGLTLPLGSTVKFAETESGPYDKDTLVYKDFTDGAKTVYFKVSKTGYNDFYGNNTVNITKRPVTVSDIAAEDKVYDGNATATLVTKDATFDGIVGEDKLTVSTTGTFSDKNVGTDKTVTFGTLTLGGDSVNNYKLADTGNQTSTTASITPKPVTVEGITAEDKVYDGNTNATLIYGSATINGKVGDDDLTYTTNATGTFANKNVANGIAVSITDLALSGNDVGNYTLASQPADTTANITKRPVTVDGITAKNKTYDGTTESTLNYDNVEFANIVEGDKKKLSVTATGAFVDAAAGEDKTVNIRKLELTGEAKDNYVLAEEGQQAETTATIEPKEVELEWSDTELTYNGKAQKPKATVTNLVGEDKCVVTVEGEETDSNVKTETKSYTAEATELSNPNYKLPEEDEKKTTEFTIAPKELTSDMLSVDPESIKNDGTKKGPNITLNDEEVGDLTDEDYKLSGETESDKSGTHFFEVEGKGNYTGTLSSSWVMYENRQNHDKQEGTGGKGDIEIFVDVIGNTENITVDNFTIDFAKKLLSEEDLERYNNGENVLIYVELKEESKDDVATKDKELILSEFNRVAAKDIRWFDITVWKRIGNDKATQIHDTVDNLEMTISVPDEYKNAPADNTRTFYLARSHDGEAEIITKTNEKKVGLSSNKFSIYALAYKDTYHGSKYIVPKTGIE